MHEEIELIIINIHGTGVNVDVKHDDCNNY